MMTPTPHPTNEYHPPMTGLEAHFEEQLAREAHEVEPAVEQRRRFTEERSRATKASSTEAEKRIEEAMHLRQ